CLQTKDFPYRF
nr:immunoglobulin light chain junction region [Macaca mulatta]